jgi:hypothetical protein
MDHMNTVLHTLVVLAGETPEPEDVKAGWLGFTVFLLLAAAVAVLAWSLVRQLRKAQAAKDAGAYGDEPVTPDSEAESAGSDSGTADQDKHLSDG